MSFADEIEAAVSRAFASFGQRMPTPLRVAPGRIPQEVVIPPSEGEPVSEGIPEDAIDEAVRGAVRERISELGAGAAARERETMRSLGKRGLDIEKAVLAAMPSAYFWGTAPAAMAKGTAGILGLRHALAREKPTAKSLLTGGPAVIPPEFAEKHPVLGTMGEMGVDVAGFMLGQKLRAPGLSVEHIKKPPKGAEKPIAAYVMPEDIDVAVRDAVQAQPVAAKVAKMKAIPKIAPPSEAALRGKPLAYVHELKNRLMRKLTAEGKSIGEADEWIRVNIYAKAMPAPPAEPKMATVAKMSDEQLRAVGDFMHKELGYGRPTAPPAKALPPAAPPLTPKPPAAQAPAPEGYAGRFRPLMQEEPPPMTPVRRVTPALGLSQGERLRQVSRGAYERFEAANLDIDAIKGEAHTRIRDLGVTSKEMSLFDAILDPKQATPEMEKAIAAMPAERVSALRGFFRDMGDWFYRKLKKFGQTELAPKRAKGGEYVRDKTGRVVWGETPLAYRESYAPIRMTAEARDALRKGSGDLYNAIKEQVAIREWKVPEGKADDFLRMLLRQESLTAPRPPLAYARIGQLPDTVRVGGKAVPIRLRGGDLFDMWLNENARQVARAQNVGPKLETLNELKAQLTAGGADRNVLKQLDTLAEQTFMPLPKTAGGKVAQLAAGATAQAFLTGPKFPVRNVFFGGAASAQAHGIIPTVLGWVRSAMHPAKAVHWARRAGTVESGVSYASEAGLGGKVSKYSPAGISVRATEGFNRALLAPTAAMEDLNQSLAVLRGGRTRALLTGIIEQRFNPRASAVHHLTRFFHFFKDDILRMLKSGATDTDYAQAARFGTQLTQGTIHPSQMPASFQKSWSPVFTLFKKMTFAELPRFQKTVLEPMAHGDFGGLTRWLAIRGILVGEGLALYNYLLYNRKRKERFDEPLRRLGEDLAVAEAFPMAQDAWRTINPRNTETAWAWIPPAALADNIVRPVVVDWLVMKTRTGKQAGKAVLDRIPMTRLIDLVANHELVYENATYRNARDLTYTWRKRNDPNFAPEEGGTRVESSKYRDFLREKILRGNTPDAMDAWRGYMDYKRALNEQKGQDPISAAKRAKQDIDTMIRLMHPLAAIPKERLPEFLAAVPEKELPGLKKAVDEWRERSEKLRAALEEEYPKYVWNMVGARK